MSYYVNRLYDFLKRLAANNNREWFAAHKAEYEELRALWLNDLDRMIAAMSAWCPEVASIPAKRAAYRIYRDTRFSPDKTPFKLYFSASVDPLGRGTEHAGYYLQMGVDGVNGLFGGLWCPPAPVLRKLRHAIVDNIEEWEEINADPELNRHFKIWCSSALKTIPKGWPKDHPQAHWLRMRDYGRDAEVGEDFFLDPAWPEKAAELFRLVKPFNDFLNYSIDEEL